MSPLLIYWEHLFPPCRQVDMKKLLLSPFIVILLVLVVLGGMFALYALPKPESLQGFKATVNRDCAPWDGSAFTVAVPMNDGTVLSISIWQSPEIDHAVSYSFPDDSGQVGNASLMLVDGMPEQLSGEVSLQGVDPNTPVEGQFDLVTTAGQKFKGEFIAEWRDDVMLCG